MSQNQNNDNKNENKAKITEWIAIAISLVLGICSLGMQVYVINRQEQLIQTQNIANREFSTGHLEVSCPSSPSGDFNYFPTTDSYVPTFGSSCTDGVKIRNTGLATAKDIVVVVNINSYSIGDFSGKNSFTDNIRYYNFSVEPHAMERPITKTNDEIKYTLDNLNSGSSFTFYVSRNSMDLFQFISKTNLIIYSTRSGTFDSNSIEDYFNQNGILAVVNVSVICNDNCINDTTYNISKNDNRAGSDNSLVYDFSLFQGFDAINKVSEQHNGKWYKSQAQVNITYLLPKGFTPPSFGSSLTLIDFNAGTDQEDLTICNTGNCTPPS